MKIFAVVKRTCGQRSHKGPLTWLEVFLVLVTLPPCIVTLVLAAGRAFHYCYFLCISTFHIHALSPAHTSLNKASCIFCFLSRPRLKMSISLHLFFSNSSYTNITRNVNGSWDQDKMSLNEHSLMCSLISLAYRMLPVELYSKVHGACDSMCLSFSKSTSHS